MIPLQANNLINNVVATTRNKLLPFMQADFDGSDTSDFAISKLFHTSPEAPDLATATLMGYCGHAQYIAHCDFAQRGYSTHWITFAKPYPPGHDTLGVISAPERLHNKAAYNHVALTVSIPTTEGVKTYLVDPTFKQFFTDPLSPGRMLENTADGELLASELRDKGFIELTEDRAKKYIEAFCNGIYPFKSSQAATTFLTQTPDDRQSGLPSSFPPRSHLEKYVKDLPPLPVQKAKPAQQKPALGGH